MLQFFLLSFFLLLSSEQMHVVVRQRPEKDESQQRRRAQRLSHQQPDSREREVLWFPGALGPQCRGRRCLSHEVVEEARPAFDAQDPCGEGRGQGEGDGAVGWLVVFSCVVVGVEVEILFI